jgi:CheY-like chemotaxis protein
MRKIAIVEDNPDNLLLFRAILEDLYEVTTYETGPEALRGLQDEQPDRCSSATTLIMNGLEFGGQEFSKRPDMIGHSRGHAGGLVTPLGLDQS